MKLLVSPNTTTSRRLREHQHFFISVFTRNKRKKKPFLSGSRNEKKTLTKISRVHNICMSVTRVFYTFHDLLLYI